METKPKEQRKTLTLPAPKPLPVPSDIRRVLGFGLIPSNCTR